MQTRGLRLSGLGGGAQESAPTANQPQVTWVLLAHLETPSLDQGVVPGPPVRIPWAGGAVGEGEPSGHTHPQVNDISIMSQAPVLEHSVGDSGAHPGPRTAALGFLLACSLAPSRSLLKAASSVRTSCRPSPFPCVAFPLQPPSLPDVMLRVFLLTCPPSVTPLAHLVRPQLL